MEPIAAFEIARLPRLEFGAGRFALLPDLVTAHGRQALLVTGAASFQATDRWTWLVRELDRRDVRHEELRVAGEPSPDLVDASVTRLRAREPAIDVVIAIGGGSVLDTAKAVAGLLRTGRSVMDHLEGVGPEVPYVGPAVPFLAVPTTAGTGSEATRNAVLSRRGPDGFKKSFRDERLVARVAIVDPDLLASCPPGLIASDGLDALTQLLESFTSTRSNPYTEALARSGLAAARDGLLRWHEAPASPGAAAARSRMAYAAHLSGICLAQTGLGAVHGLAAALGATFPIPHGIACGAALVAGTEGNVAALRARDPASTALSRYAEAGRLLADRPGLDDREAQDGLIEILRRWTSRLGVPPLTAAGVAPDDVPRLVAASRGSSMRTNPVALTDDEVATILHRSL